LLWDYPEIFIVLSGMSDPVQVENNIKLAENGFPHFLKEDEKSWFLK